MKNLLRLFPIIVLLSPWGLLKAQTIAVQEEVRAEERYQQLQRAMVPDEDVMLIEPTKTLNYESLPKEQVCFPIERIDLLEDEEQVISFQRYLFHILKRVGFESGSCIGGMGINLIMTELQNMIIGQGYTTTRILAPAQDLTSGTLQLKVLVGRVRHIKMTKAGEPYARVLSNAFPIKKQAPLNLHDIEQGLENLKRVPSVEATMEIVPTDKVDESDIIVDWSQAPIPYRFSISVDDSGSKGTGKYQGSVTFSADNPLGLNDLFYANYNHDLGGGGYSSAANNRRGANGTNGYALHYSIPWGNWRFSVNKNRHQYHQTIAGINSDYLYSGDSNNFEGLIHYMLYRDARRKTEFNWGYWARSSRNFIDDMEVDVQRRKMGGWKIGLSHREYIGNTVLDLFLEYKRGTGANNSIRAPEESFNEGTSRPKIITASLGINIPFRLGDFQWSYSGYGRAQWNRTPLITQDMFSIGSRYSVRGFDGEMSLMAERGFFYQNTIAFHYKPAHQLYLALDVGKISGPSAKYQVGHTLVGAGVGIRGQFSGYGRLNYDLFVGTPVRKPKNFRTASTNVNASFTYSF